jgi:hypothetical protein
MRHRDNFRLGTNLPLQEGIMRGTVLSSRRMVALEKRDEKRT